MSKPASLADVLLRETLRPHTHLQSLTPRDMGDLRLALMQARRFRLDDGMATLLADLSTTPFTRVAALRRPEVLESLRHGAKLPHAKTWIEFPEFPFRQRMIELGAHGMNGGPLVGDKNLLPSGMAWLLEQHPTMENVVLMTECVFGTGMPPIVLPWTHVWNTTDGPLPPTCDIRPAMLGTGLAGYVSQHIGTMFAKPFGDRDTLDVRGPEGVGHFKTHYMLAEFAGSLRYALAFLATLNDAPVVQTSVRPSGSYFARGMVRKNLEHTTLTLKLPSKRVTTTAQIAKRMIAAAHRRAHDVRGHWRMYLRGSDLLCQPLEHQWSAEIIDDETQVKHSRCANCSAWRTWIDEHKRGDVSLGYVAHDYVVKGGGL